MSHISSKIEGELLKGILIPMSEDYDEVKISLSFPLCTKEINVYSFDISQIVHLEETLSDFLSSETPLSSLLQCTILGIDFLFSSFYQAKELRDELTEICDLIEFFQNQFRKSNLIRTPWGWFEPSEVYDDGFFLISEQQHMFDYREVIGGFMFSFDFANANLTKTTKNLLKRFDDYFFVSLDDLSELLDVLMLELPEFCWKINEQSKEKMNNKEKFLDRLKTLPLSYTEEVGEEFILSKLSEIPDFEETNDYFDDTFNFLDEQ